MSTSPPPKSAKKAKQKSVLPTEVDDFTILPLTLPTLPGLPPQHGGANAKHYLYVRQDNPTPPNATSGRSLFIANVPVDASEDSMRALFAEQLGGARVERVSFDSAVPAERVYKRWKKDSGGGTEGGTEKKGEKEQRGKKRKRDQDVVAEGVVEDEESALPRIWKDELRVSGGCSVVVFVDQRSAKGALKEVKRVVKEGVEVEWNGGAFVGVDRYKAHLTLRYPPPSALHSSMNAYLSQFNTLETLRNKLRKHARSMPDEDGFITVTRGGRTGPARLEQAEEKKKELEERKKKNGANSSFYRFQTRERRKEEENKLRRGFERDRERVKEMREKRGRVKPEA